jgi:hypothetical protein
MFKAGTILTLKVQREADPETGEEFPYNRVRVIGSSPISHPGEKKADGTPKWVGQDADGCIIEPLSTFAGNLDEPYGKLKKLYDVEFVPPEVEVVREVRIKVQQPEDMGPTPEDVFAEQAAGDPDAPRRFEPKPSPLDAELDPGENGTSVLGDDPGSEEITAEPTGTASPLGD